MVVQNVHKGIKNQHLQELKINTTNTNNKKFIYPAGLQLHYR